MIVIVGSNKGGSGKTTTATNLAVGLALAGKDVCLVDADPQRSTSRWGGDRDAAEIKPPITIIEKRDNVSAALKDLDQRYEIIVVDVPGRNSRELITGAAVADIIIAPHQASQLDLDTLEELEHQVTRARDLNPDLRVYVYHSAASTNPAVKKAERADFLEYVSAFEGFQPLETIGYHRKAYRDAIPQGKSVLEMNNPKAAEEISALIAEVVP